MTQRRRAGPLQGAAHLAAGFDPFLGVLLGLHGGQHPVVFMLTALFVCGGCWRDSGPCP